MAVMKQAKLHRDGYVVFDNAYYSAPFRLVGQKLWVRGGLAQVRLYDSEYQLVATHERAKQPGERLTHPDHLPPHKLPGLLQTRQSCLEDAARIGTATARRSWSACSTIPFWNACPGGTSGAPGRQILPGSAGSGLCACPALRRSELYHRQAHPARRTGERRCARAQRPHRLPRPRLPLPVRVEEIFGSQVGGLTWN